MSSLPPKSAPQLQRPVAGVAEVRYSLPALLRELELERAMGSFAKAKLDQQEIGKLFLAKGPRRGKAKA
jgi:hypothetical protein